jgi:hypothetical protein
MHRDDPQSQHKLVSTDFFYSYVCIVICFIRVNMLIVVQERYTEELKKYAPNVDLRSVPFDVDASYAMGGGLQHGKYVKRYCVTPCFKAKTRTSLYVCLGSSCHTYGQNVNTEN